MSRIAVCASCVLGVLFTALIFAGTYAHASEMLWLDNEYWQTGQLGSESFAHENPATPGYLATHTINDLFYFEKFKRQANGQYCAYEGLPSSLTKEEEAAWFSGVPTPHGSYQRGDGNGNVCAVWSPSGETVNWGLQLHNHHGSPEATFKCDLGAPNERCGLQHYFSVATEKEINNREAKDRPWNSYLTRPELKLDDVYDKLKLQAFQAGEKGAGWGYLCPVLEDRTTGNIVEVCYDQWLGYGPQNKESEWHSSHVAECKSAYSEFGHNYDKISIPYNTEELWNVLHQEPLKESEFPTQIWGRGNSLQIDMPSVTMTQVAELDNSPFKAKETEGGYHDEPAIGYGCGRASSTGASEWLLIGVANGVEEWETNELQPGRSESASGLTNEILESTDVWTEFSPHEIEIKSETATKITETEATITGEVNPAGYPTDYVIEYGIGAINEHATTEAPLGSGTTLVPVSTMLTALKPSTTYKYRIKAFFSNAGVGYGPEQTFSTTGRPTVETYSASFVSQANAQLNGEVNPRGSETKYSFEYGLEKEKYEHKTTEIAVGSGSGNIEEYQAIGGLQAGHEYHFRIVATNSKGTTTGLEKTFTTSHGWTLPPAPKASGGILNGVSCTSSTACIAVGENNFGGNALAESWNGSEWTTQSTAKPEGSLSTLWSVSCASSTACTAVGDYVKSGTEISLVERWNGTSWSIQSSPNPAGALGTLLTGISCSTSTDCIAVGYYWNSTKEYTLAEHWNGKEWTIQTTANRVAPYDGLNHVSCTEPKACTAVGNSSGSGVVSFAERWNGTEWTIQTMPHSGTVANIRDISCTSATSCTAVGRHSEEKATVTVVDRWKGAEWTSQSSPNPSGAIYSELTAVSCTSEAACAATGYYEITKGTKIPLAERWNGSEWMIESVPNPSEFQNGELRGASCTSSGSLVCETAGWYEAKGTFGAIPLLSRYE